MFLINSEKIIITFSWQRIKHAHLLNKHLAKFLTNMVDTADKDKD